ncbi:hypothetical protein INT47_007307, partial [Mucor saturninus]
SVGLSLVASVSKRKTSSKDPSFNKYASTTSLPNHNNKPPPARLKPSVSARPFSQFFFPVKEEMILVEQQTTRPENRRPTLTKNKNNNNRHSVSLELIDDSSNYSTSRSSSLKTIKTPFVSDNVVIATANSSSDIITSTSASCIPADIMTMTFPTSNNNKRLSGVARARTVLRLDSNKSREIRAIHVWKEAIAQLSTTDDEQDELYTILSHPALIPEQPLERQRFVRQSSPKDLTMMRFILNELIATEKSYNGLLLLIKDRYMEPMIAASRTKDALVKSADIPILFKHLPELLAFSDRLLSGFQKTRNNIGQVFKGVETDLVVFLKYAMHYRTNTKAIRRACCNVLFVKIDQENLARRDTNRLGMSDYFIAPIQRIPRYCLLIKDLQKYTHPSDSNYSELDFALKTLTGLAVAMDHVQNKVPRTLNL